MILALFGNSLQNAPGESMSDFRGVTVMPENEPAKVREARSMQEKITIGIIAASLGILPFALVSKLTPNPDLFMLWATAGWAVLSAVGAWFVPWRKFMKSQAMIKEYDRLQAREALEEAIGQPASPIGEHPLSSVADRIRKLASADQRILEIVNAIGGRLDALHRDGQSLQAAIDMEKDLGAADDDARVARLSEVLELNRVAQGQLGDALRDLHVELTVRADQDHEALFQQLNELLMDFSIDTELTEDSTPVGKATDRLDQLRTQGSEDVSSASESEKVTG